jgi:hypothetical protein
MASEAVVDTTSLDREAVITGEESVDKIRGRIRAQNRTVVSRCTGAVVLADSQPYAQREWHKQTADGGERE